MKKYLISAFAVSAIMLTMPFFAFAQSDEAQADDAQNNEQLFHDTMTSGIELYKEGKTDPEKYYLAIEQFTIAQQYSDNPQPLYNIARAYQNLGNCPEALRYFREYEYAAFVTPSYGTIEVGEFIKDLNEECGVTTGRLITYCLPSKTMLIVDKNPPVQCGEVIELRPGEHNITFKMDGYTHISRAFSIKASEQITVNVRMDKKMSRITSFDQREMTPYDYHNFAEQHVSRTSTEILNEAGVRVSGSNIQMSPNALKNLVTTKPIGDRKMLWTGVVFSSLGVVMAGVGGGVAYAAYKDKIDILDDRNDSMYYGGVAMLAIGAGIGITGTILMLVDLLQYEHNENIRMGVLTKTLADGSSISLTGNGATITF